MLNDSLTLKIFFRYAVRYLKIYAYIICTIIYAHIRLQHLALMNRIFLMIKSLKNIFFHCTAVKFQNYTAVQLNKSSENIHRKVKRQIILGLIIELEKIHTLHIGGYFYYKTSTCSKNKNIVN